MHSNTQRKRFRQPALRRGAILVLVAFMLIVIIGMAAFAIDVAYIQLVRSELRAATDSAAKAATLELAKTNGDAAKARTAAIAMAAQNRVAGRNLVLSASDVEIGTSTRQSDGSWAFTPNVTPFTSARINGALRANNANGSVAFFLAPVLGTNSFEPVQSATAAQMDLEICLVIDRSHSMCFDTTGVSWSYPSGTPTLPHTVCYPPHATLSRWAALQSSVNLFIDTIKTAKIAPRVSLVTWGSTIGTNTTEYYYTKKTEVAVATELGLTNTYDDVKTKIAARTAKVMLGGTNMSAGIDAGRTVLNGSNVRPLAKKTMILMTDGQWNQGRDPVAAAQDAANENITIHTINLLASGGQTVTQDIAETTGGRYYYSTNKAQLEAAFKELALTLPIVLTQ